MSARILSVALLAAAYFVTPANADLRGPAEVPPAGFKGQQYVDSQGCVFLRAGFGGRQTWVPRISRDHKQLCGYAPSGRAVATAEIPSIDTKTRTAKPGAPLPLPEPMQTAFDKPSPKPTAKATGGGDAYRLTCPATAPVVQKFRLESGGTRTLCTRGDGTLDGASFPRLTSGSGSDLGVEGWSGTATALSTGESVTITTRFAGAGAVPTPPPGYKLAWEDDRLNPQRGLQTARGIADQEEVWTRTTPAWPAKTGKDNKVTVRVRHADGTVRDRLAIEVERRSDGSKVLQLLPETPTVKASKSSKGAVTTASSTPKAAAAPGARMFIQVGTYGVAANADGTAGRLRGLGLPVSRSAIKGGQLQVVYAGPFASAGEAQAALSRVKGAGFGDAVILR